MQAHGQHTLQRVRASRASGKLWGSTEWMQIQLGANLACSLSCPRTGWQHKQRPPPWQQFPNSKCVLYDKNNATQSNCIKLTKFQHHQRAGTLPKNIAHMHTHRILHHTLEHTCSFFRMPGRFHALDVAAPDTTFEYTYICMCKVTVARDPAIGVIACTITIGDEKDLKYDIQSIKKHYLYSYCDKQHQLQHRPAKTCVGHLWKWISPSTHCKIRPFDVFLKSTRTAPLFKQLQFQ